MSVLLTGNLATIGLQQIANPKSHCDAFSRHPGGDTLRQESGPDSLSTCCCISTGISLSTSPLPNIFYIVPGSIYPHFLNAQSRSLHCQHTLHLNVFDSVQVCVISIISVSPRSIHNCNITSFV